MNISSILSHFFFSNIPNQPLVLSVFSLSISISALLCRLLITVSLSFCVLNDFLCAKLASPDDMESTAMLFQEKVLTDAPRIFCWNSLPLSSSWACSFSHKKSLYPDRTCRCIKKSSKAGDGLKKRKVCPSWKSDITININSYGRTSKETNASREILLGWCKGWKLPDVQTCTGHVPHRSIVLRHIHR